MMILRPLFTLIFFLSFSLIYSQEYSTSNTNCQTITSNVTTVPVPDADGIVRVCQGSTIDITGNPGFSIDGTGATTSFKMPDDSIVNGSTTSLTLNESGIYKIDYIVTDAQGCRDLTIVDVEIYVSTDPDFTGTQASSNAICLGSTVDLTGIAQSAPFIPDYTQAVTGATFLADGAGITYQTCIDVQNFDSSRIVTAATDLMNIIINMEHSYAGELTIALTAPNGSKVNILKFPNGLGARYLGEALDDQTNDPGIGYSYVITENSNATSRLRDSQVAIANPIPSGEYLPEDSFTTFIGSPLNGLWCLEIIDHLSSDNGYIFEWDFNFNTAIIPSEEVFMPSETQKYWQSHPDIISTSADGNSVTVQPSSIGQNCYYYLFEDSFGCIYSQEVCIDAFDFSIGTASDLTSVDLYGNQQGTFDLTLNDLVLLNGLSVLDYQVTYHLSLIDAQNDSNPILNATAFQNQSNPQTIYVKVTDLNVGCTDIQMFDVFILDNNALDSDGDGIFNSQEDLNGNGDLTDDDTDSDNTPNYLDTDDDNDTVLTAVEIAGIGAGPIDGIYTFIDTDNDQIENYLDKNDDGDGLDTIDEDYNNDGNPLNDDTNNNGIPDFLDNTATLSTDRFEFKGLKVYPTLVQDYLTVDATQLNDAEKLTLKIFDISGKLVHNSQILSNRSTQNVETTEFAKGVYFLKIENDSQQRQVFRFVKK